jgi:hypothetical protein
MLASITTTARDADRCYVPTRVTAVSTVPLVQCLVRQYKKHGRKIKVQDAVANLNAVLDRFYSLTIFFIKILFSIYIPPANQYHPCHHARTG